MRPTEMKYASRMGDVSCKAIMKLHINFTGLLILSRRGPAEESTTISISILRILSFTRTFQQYVAGKKSFTPIFSYLQSRRIAKLHLQVYYTV